MRRLRKRKPKSKVGREYYAPGEIALMLGCSEKSVYRRLRDGELRGVKRGGCWFVHKDDIDEYMEG